jgi:cellulose synthase/poly-beta-1,6-N-acetylglucosamine synthase-like glycosyltransferase
LTQVSILLPVRDAESTIAECLASLAAQTLADHEVIVVEDGSTDGTAEVLAAAARADSRVRVLSTPPRGLVSALNAGLEDVRAPLVARMDADDVADPRRLELQVRALAGDPTLTAVGSRVRLVGAPPGGNAGMRAYVAWQNGLLDHDAIARELFVESPLVHPSVTMRTGPLRALGGYRETGGPEDYDLWLRAAAAGWRFAKRPEALLDWRDGPSRLTRTDPRYAADRFRGAKLDALAAGLLPAVRPVVIWGAGPIGKAWSRDLRARGRRLAAFVEVDPGKIGQTIHGAPVVDLAGAARLDPDALHLGAVGDAEARARIREAAARLGLADGRDFVAVA